MVEGRSVVEIFPDGQEVFELVFGDALLADDLAANGHADGGPPSFADAAIFSQGYKAYFLNFFMKS